MINKTKYKNRYKSVKYYMLTIICIAFMVCIIGCESSPTRTNKNPEPAIITMTTTSQSVTLRIIAVNEITIDWGDRNTSTDSRNHEIIEITHEYANNGTHTIKIHGEVSYLDASNSGLTHLLTSNNNSLSILKCRANYLSAISINYLFVSLNSTLNSKHVFIGGNPGTLGSNKGLAESKNWTVFSENFGEGITILTTNAGQSQLTTLEQFTLTGYGDIFIDWGDGNITNHNFPIDSESSANFRNTYQADAIHTITIRGNVTGLIFSSSHITGLDVSKNPFLKRLRGNPTYLPIQRFSRLEALDVSKNPLMEYIRTPRESIAYLNVSNNPLLHTLEVSGSNIENLDIKNSPLLKIVNIHYNKLTNLVVRNSVSLERLDASLNRISNLDVSNNKSLNTLNLSQNNLSVLDVSNNTSLSTLRIFANQFTATALNDLFDTLHDIPIDKSIDIRNNPGTDDCDINIAEAKGWRVVR